MREHQRVLVVEKTSEDWCVRLSLGWQRALLSRANRWTGESEGQRGLFTGGGATIRVADLIGKARMIDMMLSGRLYRGQEAVDVGLAQYLVDDSEAKAYEIARAAAQNPSLSNFAICSAISHMQNMSALDAAYAEAVVAGVVNTQEAAKARLEAFARGTAAKVKPQ